MNILFLTYRFPFPPIGGDKLRIFKFLEFLSKKHSVTLFSLIDRKNKVTDISNYKNYFSRAEIIYLPTYISYLNCLVGLLRKLPLQVYYYNSLSMKRLVEKEINNFDLIFVHTIRMAEYAKRFKMSPKILDLTDAISMNYLRSINYQRGLKYLITRVEKNRVLKYEIGIVKDFDVNLLVSEIDKNYLKKFGCMGNLNVLPLGVDLSYFTFYNDSFDSNCIVFIGNMRTFPNNDAVVYFYNEIFPLILKNIPDAKFYIVGANPTKIVSSLGKQKNVVVTGQVNDLRPYLRKAVVSVCPMRTGAGMQTKILESMASGTPVVTSSMGLEGIQAVPNEEIFVADDKYEFAEKTINLIKDKELRNKLSFGGRKLVEMKYSNESIMEEFEKIIQRLKN